MSNDLNASIDFILFEIRNALVADLMIGFNAHVETAAKYGRATDLNLRAIHNRAHNDTINQTMQNVEELSTKLKQATDYVDRVGLAIRAIGAVNHLRSRQSDVAQVSLPNLRAMLPKMTQVLMAIPNGSLMDLNTEEVMMLASFAEYMQLVRMIYTETGGLE